ncbi:MAG: gas vesicle protein, partial [Pseudomonadota bacterium]
MTDFSAISAVPNGAQHLRFVEVLDRLLDRGIVVRGELWLTVADVELVFIGADLV